MKKVYIAGLALLATATVIAQQKEGKVIYQRTAQMQIVMNNGSGDETLPRTRTDKFELNFANNQMSWKQMEDEMQDDNFNGGGNTVIRTISASADDITFCDFEKARRVEQRQFFDKKFLIADSILRGNWKLSEETKTILNHLCRKATSQRIGKRMQMTMDNGNMVRKETDDTTQLVAWFTTDIPVPAGPEVQGQLPGLILELETNHGRTVYVATDISPNADKSAIKEPVKGKKISPDEFAQERAKMLDEMQRNNQGGFRMRAN